MDDTPVIAYDNGMETAFMTDPSFQPHYPTSAARKADLIVHLVGLVFSLFGGGMLLGLSVGMGRLSQTAALGVYAAGLLVMLGFSTAYNFASDRWRPIMRRLDHAGIFVMIAAVWTIAGLGAVAKLLLPGLGKRFWIGIYLALSWLVLIAAKPMFAAVPWIALMLLLIGGGLYMLGVTFYVSNRLKFKRAIWHGHVVAAAGAHWAAVLIGVLLTSR
jgi:hemolysin III